MSLWPLNQIVNDTQYYVRDAVIDYITYMKTVSPAIEGRLAFITDTAGPVITITSPEEAKAYLHTASLTVDFAVTDTPAGVASFSADLDGTAVVSGRGVDLLTLSLGSHTLTVHAADKAGNTSTKAVAFTVKATVGSRKTLVNRFFTEGKITKATISDSFLAHLTSAEASIAAGKNKTAINQLNAFINAVKAQQGKAITSAAATLLIADANWVVSHLK